MIRSFGNTRLMTQTGSSIALAGPPVVGLRGIAPGRECCGWKTRRRAVGACTPSPCKEGCNAFPKRRFQLPPRGRAFNSLPPQGEGSGGGGFECGPRGGVTENHPHPCLRSEEHTSELQSLMRISYAVFCLKQKHNYNKHKLQMHQNNN